jgi:MFS family permease
MAVPYGIMSDAKGRRLVAVLGVLGNILEEIWFYIVLTRYEIFSIRAVYAGSLLMFCGGGSVVLAASVIAMIADVAPESMRYAILTILSNSLT